MPPAQEEQEKPSTSILKERRFKLSSRRRIKCDEGHPCQACLTASSACTFEEPGKRTHPHKSKRTATLEDRMHQLETLIQAIPPAVFAAGGSGSEMNSVPPVSPDSMTSPLASFASANHIFPAGVPPPSLHVFPLTNPSTHFTSLPQRDSPRQQSPNTALRSMLGQSSISQGSMSSTEQQPEEHPRMSIHASYLYFDDEGYTRWQGETSGLPLLDLLVENHTPIKSETEKSSPDPSWSSTNSSNTTWFPNRTPRRTDVNPETLWRLITSYIVPELMDSLVQCYLCTSYYLLPFLHVPTFLADYGNPRKWGEPGFAAFIVAICCLASRHIDDPRVRSDPSEGISAGTQWFELFGRLRTLPIADRPTLYTIQADLIAAVYAVGLGKLSKAAALLSEAITVSVDAGLHRSADTYDLFDPIEDEVRKRTFWCVYLWDKQLSAHFGRPPMIRLRDCDIGEPTIVDDEFITHDGMVTQPAGTESRMSAFVSALRIMVVMESVLDIPAPRHRSGDSSAFLLRAAGVLSGHVRPKDLREEEGLLDEIRRSIPPYWAHSSETLAGDDVIRVTQAVRLHCAEQFVRMLIHRHRFSNFVAERVYNGSVDEELDDIEREAMAAAQSCALQIISSHMQVAAKGLMTYYGVHVIHQLTQAGRTLVAILINCKSSKLQPLIQPALEALRSCVGLLRRFSGRYVCGQRSGDLMEEFCRITQIPLETSRPDTQESNTRPPWIRPVRKKTPSTVRGGSDNGSQHSSPEAFSPSDFFVDPTASATSPIQGIPQNSFSPAPGGSSYTLSAGRRSSLSVPSFLDSSNGMDMDPGMYMSPEVMNMFGDGGVDVTSLFSPDFSMGPHSTEPHDSIYGHSSGSTLVTTP
ncbi:fungal-specific transcription factor domain-containing protein [Hygrophoropsis aurantiaca]|uniref:Fungal-specific transcription factor domain-containing protein n=1 Tax=Hygrophoropsis aurantiaca TaxID=72124 RepID=A0ACB8A9V5_9AGAM|nr:fungal-specific transcription factor domain-containing protein [Hygrophoropsis aurantiaca]